MRVIDLENITVAMRDQTRFVLRCEEVFHDKISAAASTILSAYPKRPYVALTGPSGSGKTTTAMRLKAYLENLGVPVCLLKHGQLFSLACRPAQGADRLGIAAVRQLDRALPLHGGALQRGNSAGAVV